MRMFEVGGCVRDELMGVASKDVDFVCLAESFGEMVEKLEADGFKLHVVKPEFVTVRAGVPEGHVLRERTKDADFVLARKDSATGDGRRPDFVEAGTLEDDLARRDFTVNAIARDTVTGELIDPHGGADDVATRVLRFVGDPDARVREDGLRVLRGLRFMVMKGFKPTRATMDTINSKLAVEMLAKVSAERVRDELDRMFAFDTVMTLEVLGTLRGELVEVMFSRGVRLGATMKGG